MTEKEEDNRARYFRKRLKAYDVPKEPKAMVEALYETFEGVTRAREGFKKVRKAAGLRTKWAGDLMYGASRLHKIQLMLEEVLDQLKQAERKEKNR